MITAHATCIAFDGRGVLLRGSPGSGKSDLALRAIADGAFLVADDRVVLTPAKEGVLMASAPRSLQGMIEIRGLGIMRVDAEAEVPLALIVDLTGPGDIERMPEPRFCDLDGVALPLIALSPFEASAVAKLRFALAAVTQTGRLLPS